MVLTYGDVVGEMCDNHPIIATYWGGTTDHYKLLGEIRRHCSVNSPNKPIRIWTYPDDTAVFTYAKIPSELLKGLKDVIIYECESLPAAVIDMCKWCKGNADLIRLKKL